MSKNIFFLILLIGTLFAYTGNGGGSSGDNDDDNMGDLVASLSTNCDLNTVTVKDGDGLPVANASVDVFNEFNLNQILDDELTDANGEVTFEGCGQEVRIIATKHDYKTYTITRDLIRCRECGCLEDGDCSGTEACVDGQCEEVDCCGVVMNHTCVPDECGSGERCGNCPEGEQCVDRVCLEECETGLDCSTNSSCTDGVCMPRPQCEDDGDCKDNEQCVEISEGLMVCSAIGGCCGIIGNHSCVEYECGTGENCMSCSNESFCVEHECVMFSISPEVVNRTIEVSLPPNCPNCTIRAIAPDGNSSDFRPDNSSMVRIPVRTSGIYVVALMGSDGRLFVKEDVLISLFAEPQKDFFTTMIESPIFWLMILLLLVVFAIIYPRLRKR